MKVNNNIGKMDNLSMLIITLIATGVSIAFFGYLTVVLVNITKKIGIGSRNSCTYLVLIKFNYWNEYF